MPLLLRAPGGCVVVAGGLGWDEAPPARPCCRPAPPFLPCGLPTLCLLPPPLNPPSLPKTAAARAQVVGRIYHRGSGDRHSLRSPSFPAFEGYSLAEADGAGEGELSRINRVAGAREQGMMAAEFRDKLLYNLGVTGAYVCTCQYDCSTTAGGRAYGDHTGGAVRF